MFIRLKLSIVLIIAHFEKITYIMHIMGKLLGFLGVEIENIMK
ncbi:hypothetical protein CLCAR_1212 [Clostridium carboxidivorans P7]|nr:hypothetical protein CLCAR_1212 [Clostridium carboxidivorans P7]